MRTRAELRQGGRYGFKTEGSIYLCPQLLTQPDERFLQTIRTAEHKDLESEKTVAVKRNSSSTGFWASDYPLNARFAQSAAPEPFRSCPFFQFAPGQQASTLSCALPMPLPPEVAKGIMVLPEKS